jgi:hypothetical protein
MTHIIIIIIIITIREILKIITLSLNHKNMLHEIDLNISTVLYTVSFRFTMHSFKKRIYYEQME